MTNVNLKTAIYLTFFHKKKWIWIFLTYVLFMTIPYFMNMIPNHPGFIIFIDRIRFCMLLSMTMAFCIGFIHNLYISKYYSKEDIKELMNK